MRTGEWVAGTKLTVHIGASGSIYGAGGDGGDGDSVSGGLKMEVQEQVTGNRFWNSQPTKSSIKIHTSRLRWRWRWRWYHRRSRKRAEDDQY